MDRRKPVVFEVFPPRTVQRLSSGRGGEGNVWYTRCIEGWEPKIYELWTFAEGVSGEAYMFAQVQISNDFSGETFHTHFSNEKSVRIPFLGRRSVNGSVQWLDIPRPFVKTGVATAAWTENIYVKLWCSMDSPTRSLEGDLINLCSVARRVRDDLLNTNRVERFQTLQ